MTSAELDALAEAAMEADHADWSRDNIDRLEADALEYAPDRKRMVYVQGVG